MGKHRTIDHRRPPREAGIPKIARHRDGKLVPLHPEPIVESPVVLQLRAELIRVQGCIHAAEAAANVKTAERDALVKLLENARDETETVRQQLREIENEGAKVARVEIITVDTISRDDDIATIKALCDVDGNIGETAVVLSVEHIRTLLARKKNEESMPEVRATDEERDLPDRVDYSTETFGDELSDLRDPPAADDWDNPEQ